MRSLLLLTLFVLGILTPGYSQSKVQTNAGELADFEAKLLLSNLNRDREWLDSFLAGRLKVHPMNGSIGDRGQHVGRLQNLGLKPDQFKIRITGTIEALTSDPSMNRKFDFLDTFNLVNGKWQMIASHFSPASDNKTSPTTETIQRQLLDLEYRWAQVDVTNDRSIFAQIIAPEFVATDSKGVVRERDTWRADWTYENVKTAGNVETRVNVVNENLAIVTGVTVKQEGSGEITHRDRFTDTWVRRNGQWQCVAAHVSRLQ